MQCACACLIITVRGHSYEGNPPSPMNSWLRPCFLSISTVPSAPLYLRATCTGPNSINITWSAPANANGILLQYNIYLRNEQVIESRSKVTTDLGIYNSFSFTKLVQTARYRIEVSAETRIGEGASTMLFCVIMDNGTYTISPLSFVKTINSTAIMVAWGDPEYRSVSVNTLWFAVPGYILYHNVTSEGQLNVDLPVMNTGSHTHVFQGLVPFTYYGFSVSFYAYALKVLHYCGAPSEIVVARTDEDGKLSHLENMPCIP